MISEELIEDVAGRLAELNQEDASELIRIFSEEQPEIFGAIVSSPEEYTEAESEIQLYLGLLIWQAMKTHKENLPAVSENTIERTIEKNIAILEKIDDDSEGDAFVFVENLMDNYAQPNLLLYVVESLLTGEENEDMIDEEGMPQIREEVKGSLLLLLKTVIDCLDAA